MLDIKILHDAQNFYVTMSLYIFVMVMTSLFVLSTIANELSNHFESFHSTNDWNCATHVKHNDVYGSQKS